MTMERIPVQRDGSRVVHLANAQASEWRGLTTYEWADTVCGRPMTAEWSVLALPAVPTCTTCRRMPY